MRKIKIIDASWTLPTAPRTGREEYDKGHIPGAVFFDIDDICNKSSALPHMLPTPESFAQAAGDMGITAQDAIVIYDHAGLFSAARVWWTFKTMGVKHIRILDGGLPAWIAAEYDITSIVPQPLAVQFAASFNDAMVVSLAQMKKITLSASDHILDARPAPRYNGSAPEPRAGLSSGHMPNSINLPFSELIDNGRLKPDEDLKAIFTKLNLSKNKEIITSCGSGVTAAIISFALAVIGQKQTALYDGAWTEWASQNDTEIISR